jgi:hypothetical protein
MVNSGTISFADLYGAKQPDGEANSAPDSQKASGGTALTNHAPAISWVLIIVSLIAIRLLQPVLEK